MLQEETELRMDALAKRMAVVGTNDKPKVPIRRRRFRLCQESIENGSNLILKGTVEAKPESESQSFQEECSIQKVLSDLFQYYSSFGQDKGVLEDREYLHLCEFEKFMKEVGMIHSPSLAQLYGDQESNDEGPKFARGARVSPGDVVVAFERQASKCSGKSKLVVNFQGFVSALAELSFLRYGGTWIEKEQAENREANVDRAEENGAYLSPPPAVLWCFVFFLQDLVFHGDGLVVWKAARAENKNRCKKATEVIPSDSIDMDSSSLLELIFRHYTVQNRSVLSFDLFVKFAKDFELFPQLCSRRSVAMCFRSASQPLNDLLTSRSSQYSSKMKREKQSEPALSLPMFHPCLVLLSQEIFNQTYFETEVRTPERSFSKLIDLLRASKSLLYKMEADAKARVKKRLMAQEQRRIREEYLESVNQPSDFVKDQAMNITKSQDYSTSGDPHPRVRKSTPRKSTPQREGGQRNGWVREKHNGNNVTGNKAASETRTLLSSGNLKKPQVITAESEVVPAEFSPSLRRSVRKNGSPSSNHHITIYADGTIDILRVSPRSKSKPGKTTYPSPTPMTKEAAGYLALERRRAESSSKS